VLLLKIVIIGAYFKNFDNLWFEIDTNGIATINVAKAEMGQHVGTALAQALVEKLEVHWEDVRIRHIDTDPKWGLMITGGSWSVNWSFDTLSRAGAAGRIALFLSRKNC
jgi:isoquinoline 1-oxidoreductase beta subunit